RGRIVASRLTRQGSSYAAESFNFVYGEPLNVTDVDIGPDGNVYFALGGRNTTGAIYRVVYEGNDVMERPAEATPLDRVLSLPQPRSSFSRQQTVEIRDELGAGPWQQGLTAVARDGAEQPERRVRAL